MQLFDLHCDTIYECLARNCNMDDESLHITAKKSSKYAPYIQCFAICVPQEITGDRATQMFLKAYDKLLEQCRLFNFTLIKSYGDIQNVVRNRGRGAIFTVENASVLAGKIENISLLSECNVKFVTLTWNGRNELGAGSAVSHSNGITPFGIKVVEQLDKNNIIVDLSHASDRLFNDVIMYSKNPVVATHSDSRAVTNNKRNLTDKQFKIIAEKNGIVGINLFCEFLNENPEKASKFDVLRHIEHFMSLGGEDTVALGADFDGCTPVDDISSIENMSEIYELLLCENYSEALVKKLFFENALKFCQNFDK